MNLIVKSIIGLILVSSYSSSIFAQDIECLFLGDNAGHQPPRRFAELQPALLERGIQLVYTDQVDDLNAETLAKYDALVLYANIDNLTDEPAKALLNYVDKGGAFVPLHCASYCFRNQPELVELIGAQFKSHGTGVFQAKVTNTEHPITSGYGGFTSWDETYVHHMHNDKNRTILEYRFGESGREPWTWTRTQGKGRVFYTAWGHDSRTWTNPGFQNLVERGIRWAVKKDPQAAGKYLGSKPFPVPKMNAMPKEQTPFEYVDVGSKIPNYTPSDKWGVQGKPLNLMQKPLAPTESLKHLVVPEGFHVELFASEPDLAGKPIAMAWDERGRLWVCETLDYPNELKPQGKGRDRIRICEDTDHDGAADKFTVFAERLSVPTSMAFHRGGVIVQNGTETLYLKDTDGDDVADQRDVLVTGWNLGDTHGGVSNFQYGLDNWIWGMQGYNNSKAKADGSEAVGFRQGFFRFRPDGSEVEFIRSTNNNTWGLGISEEGIIFGSTANGCPSVYMPIPNRYYERVLGWTPSLTLQLMADSSKFAPITDKVRQVDWHGKYTAGAGHALYTAREYPRDYWNRVAFVNGPTGHLVGAFVINGQGSDFNSTSPFNLLASDDEWTAPIMSEVGPDGQMWVLDWYNYIVQHNPTPQGFETGKGAAYKTELRDKKHGRIYRVVANSSRDAGKAYPNLAIATPSELVAALSHPTMLIRKHAQRLLVERGEPDVADELIDRIRSPKLDEIGLDAGAIHALWTLHGLGLLKGSNQPAYDSVVAALDHPSAGVRRNAVQVLPHDPASVNALLNAGLHRDRDHQVRLAAILAIADRTNDNEAAADALMSVLSNPTDMAQRWIRDALMSAAAVNSQPFLSRLVNVKSLPESSHAIVATVAEHHARSNKAATSAELLASLSEAQPAVIDSVLNGLSGGWKSDRDLHVSLPDTTETKLLLVFNKISPTSKGKLVTLATTWGSDKFVQYGQDIAKGLLKTVSSENATEADRITAANELTTFLPDDENVVQELLSQVTIQTPPAVSLGLIRAAGKSRSKGVGGALVKRLATMTPDLKRVAFLELLKRPASTTALLDAAELGQVSLDELDLDQRNSLMSHPNANIKMRATKLLSLGGSLPNADRQGVIEEYAAVALRGGDPTAGKLQFKTHCAKCHIHGDEGIEIGPNLTGMAVHPKEELLVHILDPSRSVEANFRAYKALTIDGVFVTGMLASESKTSIEMVDTEGKKISLLRDDLEELSMSKKSVMPEGFEKSLPPGAMADLLQFLTQKGQFLPLPIERVASAVSTRGLFSDSDNGPDRMIFDDWKPKTFRGVPFLLVNPQLGKRPNAILLHGPNHPQSSKYPRSVKLPVNSAAKAIHILGGVGGWNFPFSRQETVSATVRLHYADGASENHDLINGRHIADYIRRVDVPESEFAFALGGQQLRYLSIQPKRTKVIEAIELIKGSDRSSPIFMALTLELETVMHGE